MRKLIALTVSGILLLLQFTAAQTSWELTGNSGTDPAVNFIGTTDLQPLSLRLNNQWSGELSPITHNYFIGLNAGLSGGTTFSNIGIGTDALRANNAYDASGLVAIGYGALKKSVGLNNTAIGGQSLTNNTTGFQNTAVGILSQYNNITGYNNTAVGSSCMYANTTGSHNTAMGAGTLATNNTGGANAAFGFEAIRANINGSFNTATGTTALRSNTTGNGNTAIGYQSIYSNTTGSHNTAVGRYALYNNTTGTYNIAIGVDAGVSSGAFNNTVSIGNHGWLNGFSNQVFLGNASTTWIGGWKPWSVYSDGRIKKNIKEDIKGLEFILKLRPVSYYTNLDDAVKITGNKKEVDFPGKYDADRLKLNGFIAQEVEQAALSSGYDFDGVQKPRSEQDLYSVSYSSFVVPLVKAVQEQQELIAALQKELLKLQSELERLNNKCVVDYTVNNKK